uniref:Uncharacterized protein n=1 Tax=Plectus sambesii TaxID=2011161 RepID=A0A914WBL4_9BILA
MSGRWGRYGHGGGLDLQSPPWVGWVPFLGERSTAARKGAWVVGAGRGRGEGEGRERRERATRATPTVVDCRRRGDRQQIKERCVSSMGARKADADWRQSYRDRLVPSSWASRSCLLSRPFSGIAPLVWHQSSGQTAGRSPVEIHPTVDVSELRDRP